MSKDTMADIGITITVIVSLALLWAFMLLPFYLLFTSYWWISIVIFSWTYYDRETVRNGGRRIDLIYRHFPLSRLCIKYFDMKLIKTADLNPEKNYILGYHPHGSTVGLLANILSPFTGFRDLFPGITSYLAVFTPIVMFPLARDVLMAIGAVDCGKESFHSLLYEKKGVALTIAVGGSYEVFDIQPRLMRCTVKRRKGFVRMALKYGASLVPVLAFGDNDVYNQLLPNKPGSRIRQLQEYIYSKTGCSFLVIPWGQYGLVPFRTSIHCVVGRPIDVPQILDPSPEVVDEIHARYLMDLEQLFHDYKNKFPGGENLVLELV